MDWNSNPKIRYNKLNSLEVYKLSKQLTRNIYLLTKQFFPENERFGLTSQIQRAAVSICANISEGQGRSSIKERNYFIDIAKGSLVEVICLLDLSVEIGIITPIVLEELIPLTAMLETKLFNMKKSLYKS